MVAEPDVFALVVAADELSRVAVALLVEPEVDCAVAEPHVFALAFAADGPSPEVVFVVDLEGPEPGVAIASVPDVAEPLASVDIASAFEVLFPVSLVVVEGDSLECPNFLSFPNVDHCATFSNSVEAAGEESVRSSICGRANHGLCSTLSNLGLYQNRNSEQCYNKPNPYHNHVSGTTALPTDATTSHPRKTSLCRYQEQRKRWSYQASL